MKRQSWIILCSVTMGVVVASSCAVSFPEFQPTPGTGGTSSSTTASGTGGVGPGTGGTTAPGTGGSTTPGTGGSGPGPGSGGGGVVASCKDYCDTITNNCTGENKEYITNDTCLAMCKDMVPGHVGDTSGDTVGCRLTQAKSASASQVKYCQLAGPVGGDGACTHNPCDAFCNEVDTTCGEDSPWPGDPQCQAACGKWAYLLTRDTGTMADAGAGIGDLYQAASGSLNCRIYHLEAANNTQDPMMPSFHCKYHLPSGGPCGP